MKKPRIFFTLKIATDLLDVTAFREGWGEASDVCCRCCDDRSCDEIEVVMK
jgi:hypothetical protein